MKKINENIKLIIVLIMAIVISSMISIKAATTLSSTSVYYDTSKSGGSSSNVNGAIDELYSLTTDREKLKAEILNLTYPVGSIYMSTEDDTVDKVQERFGGTWVKYAEDMTLVGASSSKAVNTTGGSSSVTLSTSNLPSHSHVIPSLSVSSWSGSHTHTPYAGGYFFQMNSGLNEMSAGFAPGQAFDSTNKGRASQTASASITVSGQTTTASNTGTTGSGSSFSVQNPYTVVYMYKRTA